MRASRSSIALAALVVVVVLTGAVGSVGAADGTASIGTADGTVAPSDPAPATGDDELQSLGLQPVDADRTRMEITLREDGSAAWELELWTRLSDDEDREAFASLREEIEDDPGNYTARFEDRMDETVAAASDSTDREMAIEDVEIDARTEAIPEEYGVVTYSFTWDGFAVAEGDELRAGDAIDGLLLEDGTRLTMTWPAEYREASVDPEPTSRATNTVVWQGDQRDFVRGQPRLVVTTAPAEDEDRDWLPIALVASALILAVAALAWLVRTGRIDLGGIGGEASTEGAATAAGGAGKSEGAVGDESGGTAGGGAGAEANSADADGAGDPDADDDGPPSELLSNEEQVLQVLERNGGRVKQQQVVEELDWTEAKTSQVVTSMREDDEIEAFRIGRENVLALPDESDL